METQAHYAEFAARGATVVAVGQGTGEESAGFCRDLGTDFACLGDPTKRGYRSFGLTRDGWWNVTVKPFLDDPALAAKRIANASLRGSMMRHTDVLQLGGVVVVDGGGVVRFLHRSARTDDLPPTADILAALDRLPEAGANAPSKENP